MCGVHNTPDQDALIQLAKDAKQRGGVSTNEAETLIRWAIEYGVDFQPIKSHPERNFNIPHIHIGPVNHLPVN